MLTVTERRWLISVATLFLALLATPLVGVGYATLRNNHEMNKWRSEFYGASQIDGAEVESGGSRFGLQPGTNGNHCDREAWLVYRTKLSPEHIEAHFEARLDPERGYVSVTADPMSGTVRVDYWYRFDDPGWDMRCV